MKVIHKIETAIKEWEAHVVALQAQKEAMEYALRLQFSDVEQKMESNGVK